MELMPAAGFIHWGEMGGIYKRQEVVLWVRGLRLYLATG